MADAGGLIELDRPCGHSLGFADTLRLNVGQQHLLLIQHHQSQVLINAEAHTSDQYISVLT
jgi:hypothetical protein